MSELLFGKNAGQGEADDFFFADEKREGADGSTVGPLRSSWGRRASRRRKWFNIELKF